MKSSSLGKIEKLLRESRNAVEDSGRKIDAIVTNTREKIHNLKDELIEVSARIAALIVNVDGLDKKIVELRFKAKSFELSFGKNSEETKALHSQIKEYMQMAEAAHKEESELILRRNSIELFLKENGELLEESEKVLKQVLVALSYLDPEVLPSSDKTVLRVINASDAEKKRLSRDIHDGPAQSLVNIMLMAEYAEKIIEVSPNKLQTELKNIKLAAKDTLTDIRRIIFDLMPYTMTDYGIVETLTNLFKSMDSTKFELKIEEKAKVASKVIENNLFRIAQEIMSNIKKHSRAKKVSVEVIIDEKAVKMNVTDDGIGFDREKLQGGYGLVSISDRVELLDGVLDIKSRSGEGTKILITVPNKENRE